MPGYELIGKEEKKSVNQIFDNGGVLFRLGFEKLRKNKFKVIEFERKFANYMGMKYALAVTSGTAALRVALASLNLKPGDEVITQAFTFVATVEAIVEAKLKPVCCEIDETLNMCPKSLIKKINKKTKAIILVHMLGISGHIDEIKNICKKKNISIIEDTAWGCGGYYGNKRLGTIGRMGTFSFDYAKSMTTGEGGMILFKNKKDYESASAWHDHGHENNPKKKRWEDTRKRSGFNFRMTELQAAVGLEQLKKLKSVITSHRKNKKLIQSKIKKLNLTFRIIPKKNRETADSLIFLVKNKKMAKFCRLNLNKNGVQTKILPEATTWHFAKYWSHIPEIDSKERYKISSELLDRAVSIPINIKMQKNFPNKIFKILNNLLKKN